MGTIKGRGGELKAGDKKFNFNKEGFAFLGSKMKCCNCFVTEKFKKNVMVFRKISKDAILECYNIRIPKLYVFLLL